uniref:Uncharacterized protein K0098B12.34 n=1 Tax=Oryza sativa subsp. indica TaxID=39946 RepID=C8TF70_ORYSI|nr:hypothetical protein [Oryza sativa Indica Group]
MLATASSSSTMFLLRYEATAIVLLAWRYIKPSTRERAAAWEDQSSTIIVPFPTPSSSCYYRLLFATYIGKLCRLFFATDVEFRHRVVIVTAIIWAGPEFSMA